MPRNMVPELGEHAIFLGENKQGKSYLASGLLAEFSQQHPVIVFDTKGEERFDPWVDTPDWDEVRERMVEGRQRTVYRPIGDDLEAKALDSRLREIYDSGWSGAVYLDELEHMTPNSVAPPGIRYVLLSGRRRKLPDGEGGRRICKLGLWTAAHRPAFIPHYSLNEPVNYYVFGLANEDLKKIRPYLGDYPITRPDQKWFWFYRKGAMTEPKLMPPVKER